MTIHNLMEDFVYAEVNRVFDAAKDKNEPWFTCNCLQCRFDTVCYVLNRISPRYTTSGRGMAHFIHFDQGEKNQLIADISILAFEGMKTVLATQRPHTTSEKALPSGPVFNFPTLTGRIVDGQTFTPVHDIPVSLYLESTLVGQINHLWENPYIISSQTPGTYTFWPFPSVAEAAGENRIFNLFIHAEREGCDPIHYHFKLGLTSDFAAKKELDADNCHHLPDLYLFNKT
ncbi:MAG: late competence development ComFB family protein [Treponema sp.]